MKRLRVTLALGAILQGVLAANGQSLQALQSQLDQDINAPSFAQAEWGIKVLSLDTGITLFEHNAAKLLKPASNTKLYTTALALDRLGPDFRIRTSFYAAAKPDATGTIHGDVIIYGRGDPSFSSRFNDGDYAKALEPAVDALIAAGVKRVEGNLIGDDSYFRGAPYGSEWTWDDLQEYYGAPASALSLQDNVIDLVFKPAAAAAVPCRIFTEPQTEFMQFRNGALTAPSNMTSRIHLYRPLGEDVTYVSGRVALGSSGESDSVSVAHPALWFATMLKEKLAQRGIVVLGHPWALNWLDRQNHPLPTGLVEIAHVDSRPLAEIVRQTLKPSENLYAQLLLLQIGAHRNAPQLGRGTESEGLAEMYEFLREVGIERRSAMLTEGSGLSRACVVTPDATVQLLTFVNRRRYRQAFIDALPIAGVDGTLRHRFRGTPAAGNVRAKTGSLGGVSCLSGFLTTAGNEHLVFSVMLNNYFQEAEGRDAIDDVVEDLVAFSGRSNTP